MSATGIIEWFLDLEGLRLGGGEPLSVEWRHAVPLWLLLVLGAAAVFAVLTVYRREHVPPERRAALVVVRLLLIALVGALLCGPSLVLQRNRVERSYVNLLIDSSSSMATRDAYADAALADAIARGAGLEDVSGLVNHPRIELVKAALAQNEGSALAALLEHNDLQV
ncbi:MAG: hypothetical protein KJ749_00325 [Planctomycetes bacterium]|nr:hypothetical protein [Planctomycetota bacterium]